MISTWPCWNWNLFYLVSDLLFLAISHPALKHPRRVSKELECRLSGERGRSLSDCLLREAACEDCSCAGGLLLVLENDLTYHRQQFVAITPGPNRPFINMRGPMSDAHATEWSSTARKALGRTLSVWTSRRAKVSTT